MFIETWVYEELGRPKIKVKEPVSGSLVCNEDLSWINKSKETNEKTHKKLGKIFLRGGCDVASLVHYLKSHGDVVSEFNTVINSLPQRIDHSNVFLNSINNNNLEMATSLGLHSKELETNFNSDYDLYIFSFWADVDIPVYSNNINSDYLPFWLTGSQSKNLITEREIFKSLSSDIDTDVINFFQNHMKHHKFLSNEEMINNYEEILSHIPHNKKVIMLGANSKGIQYFNGNKKLNPKHENYNNTLIELSKAHDNVYYINVNEIIKERHDILDLNHFNRMTYHTIYNKILETI